tara:strand:- start:1002 stop:1592 length:591 start_codon:yes stop_codon:yes gene_type:complete
MKKIVALVLLGINLNANSQIVEVEKSFFSLQTGFAGVWVNNETRLSNRIALRTEIGLEHDFFVGDQYDGADFIFQPVVTVEPRYYYNLERRSSNGNKTSKNSANYLSLKTSYHPDCFVLNLDDAITKTADLSIIPTWGMKRQIGSKFTYETGIGFGYRMVYLKPNYYNGSSQNVDNESTNRGQYTPYLHLRIGYIL